jgi:hypothetical protein
MNAPRLIQLLSEWIRSGSGRHDLPRPRRTGNRALLGVERFEDRASPTTLAPAM